MRKRKFVAPTDRKHGLPIGPNLLARDFTYTATDEGRLCPMTLFRRWSDAQHQEKKSA